MGLEVEGGCSSWSLADVNILELDLLLMPHVMPEDWGRHETGPNHKSKSENCSQQTQHASHLSYVLT